MGSFIEGHMTIFFLSSDFSIGQTNCFSLLLIKNLYDAVFLRIKEELINSSMNSALKVMVKLLLFILIFSFTSVIINLRLGLEVLNARYI